MIFAKTHIPRRMAAHFGSAGALLASATLLLGAVNAPAEEEPLGRVVALRGEVYATAPDGTVRTLECHSPVYSGDRVQTEEDGGLGVLSGDFYTRLGGEGELGFVRTRVGTPGLDLTQGHVRLLDAGASGAPVGRIVTPGLVADKASRDTDALVMPEKISLVSMICGWDGGLDVGRVDAPDETVHPRSGECAIGKPGEPLYTARATHGKLPIMDEDACPSPDSLALVGVGDHFSPYDVAGMLPPVDAAGPIVLPNVLPPSVADREPCTVGTNCLLDYDPWVGPSPVIPALPGFTPSPVIPPLPGISQTLPSLP
ncbi:MAG: hypothetical protein JRH19_18765 [Deltaproteobacteria bacterium]|nr:hypothetical protein [Deltaproteobacteria bacterium]